jgi:hypothetical protein
MHKILSDLVKYSKENELTSAFIKEYVESKLVDIPLSKGQGENSVKQTPPSPTFEKKNELLEDEKGTFIEADALGDYAVALGGTAAAIGKRSVAQGHRCVAEGETSHVEGNCAVVKYINETLNGYGSHAEGYSTVVAGTYAHAEGNKTIVVAPNAHAEGFETSISEKGESAHAEGYGTTADAPASHAEGNHTRTSKAYSHAEGRQTETIGEASHTEGNETITEGDYAHAEGWMTRAKGAYSHAEGQYTFTHADAAHSEGNNTHARAPFSHAEGIGTKTNPNVIGQHVEGYYNAESDSIKIIGCGTSNEDRKNAVEVTQDGRVFIKDIGNFNGVSKEASDLKTVLEHKANSGDVYNKTEMDNRIKADLVQKVEVATINGQSLINGGNIEIKGGGSSYDDTEIREELSRLETDKADKSELTELSAEVGKKVDVDFVNNAIAAAITTTLNEEV